MSFSRSIVTSFLLLLVLGANAQIVITNADMPNVNDTIRLSVKKTLTGFKENLTGPNYNWDYSFLVPDSQRVEKIYSPGTTVYPFVSFFSTYARPNPNPDLIPFILLGSPPTNAYHFYKKQNSQLTIAVHGVTVTGAALPIPISPPDVIYKFPLDYGDTDSSFSGYAYPVAGTGYFRKKQKRVNTVDGWGQLTTPYGTFNTLRVKSVITIVDSIYLDTLGFGFNLPQPLLYEYKWLAPGCKLPILEIDATGAIIGNGFTVTGVLYQDSLVRDVNVATQSTNTCPKAKQGSAQAFVSGGRHPLTYKWNNNETTASINNLDTGLYTVTITDRYGKSAVSSTNVTPKVEDIGCLSIPNAFTPDGDGVNDYWNIRSLNEFKNCNVKIYNQWGSIVYSSTGYMKPWDGQYNNQPAEAGTYYYVMDLGKGTKEYTGALTIIK